MAEFEKVIKGIECCLGGSNADACEQCPYEDECAHAVGKSPSPLRRDALSLLKAQEQGWISVKDRLPDEQGTYLVFRKEPYGMITIAWYSGHENGWLALDGGFYADGVLTHYMPLPEPPKEAKE